MKYFKSEQRRVDFRSDYTDGNRLFKTRQLTDVDVRVTGSGFGERPPGFYLKPMFWDISQCETQTLRVSHVGNNEMFLLGRKLTRNNSAFGSRSSCGSEETHFCLAKKTN